MILLTTFLMNVLCAMVPCPPSFPEPEITYESVNQISDRSNYKRPLRNTEDASKPLVDFQAALNFLETFPRIKTSTGEIEGYFMTSVGGKRIYAFEGIPYAEAPVGSRRFQPPVPKKPWKSLLKAKRVGAECLQYNPFRAFRIIGNEDCLFLNVYVPPTLPDITDKNLKKLPIMVWIHGGFYNFGAGSDYGPSYLLEKDVILVTLNYRLGVLGFLSTGDGSCPGNNGLKDQALALDWVADNAASFGGDPNKITLAGFSAGGSSVHFHMMSSREKRFQQGISLSGSAFNPWAILPLEEVRKSTIRMAKLFQCPTSSSKIIVNCLKSQSPANLVGRQSALFPRWPMPYVLFTPVVEPTQDNEAPLVTETAEQFYSRNHSALIPWMSSMTKQEGHFALLFPSMLGRMMELRRYWKNIASKLLVFEDEAVNVTETTEQVTRFYFDQKRPEDAPIDVFSQMYTDRHFGNGLHESLKHHSKLATTYAYLFNYMGKYNMGNLIGYRKEEWGVGHAEDTFYIFNSSSSYSGFKKTDTEFKLSTIMVNLISNFVSTGEPLYTGENGTNFRIWDPVDPQKPHYLQFDADIKMVPEPHQERIAFWESLNLRSRLASEHSNSTAPATTIL